MNAIQEDLEAQARASLSLFSFGDSTDFTIVSQQVHPTTGRLKVIVDERAIKTKGNDMTLYLVRSTVFIPATHLREVLPVLMDSTIDNTNHTMQFYFGGKAVVFDELFREENDVGVLSLKQVMIDQGGMLKTRWQSNLIDYQTTVIPDWTRDYAANRTTDMHVRIFQSWTDVLEAKDKAVSPRGIMVRESVDGGVEVHFALSFVEAGLINMPRRSRYQKLAMSIAKLEETVVSRRVSRSFHNRTEPSTWVSDDFRQTCHICVTKFRVNKRRHHCRLCGEVACDTCAPKVDITLPSTNETTAVRICMACVHKEPTIARRQRTASIVEAISDAMYFKGGEAASAANTIIIDSYDGSECGSDDPSETASSCGSGGDRLLNLTLQFESCLPTQNQDYCGCCRDKLSAIRYECSNCNDMVCNACNLSVNKRRGKVLPYPENLCRTCVLQEKKSEAAFARHGQTTCSASSGNIIKQAAPEVVPSPSVKNSAFIARGMMVQHAMMFSR